MANKDSFCPSLQKLTKEIPHLDTLEVLLSRISSTHISKPVPQAEELDIIVKAAMRAPDWHHLRPFHFTYFSVDLDEEVYKEVVMGATKEAFGVEDDLCYQQYLQLRERAPALLVVSSRYKEHQQVTKRDQFACCFAATYAAQLAAQALGYCSFLFTSGYEKSPTLRKLCGVSGDDEVLAIINIGTDHKMKYKEIKSNPRHYLTLAQSAEKEALNPQVKTGNSLLEPSLQQDQKVMANFREKFKAQVRANLEAKKAAAEAEANSDLVNDADSSSIDSSSKH